MVAKKAGVERLRRTLTEMTGSKSRANTVVDAAADAFYEVLMQHRDLFAHDRVAEPCLPYGGGIDGAIPILRDELVPFGVVVDNVLKGRPTVVRLRATKGVVTVGEMHDDWFVDVDEEGVFVTVVFSTTRHAGHAGFSASGFLDLTKPATETHIQPALYFFVLLEEARVWVVARTALRDIYKKLRRGGKVPRFQLTRSEDALRLLLPKKKLGIDVSQSVMMRS